MNAIHKLERLFCVVCAGDGYTAMVTTAGVAALVDGAWEAPQLRQGVPCHACSGDGLSPLGRQLALVGPELGPFVERMALTLKSAPLGPGSFKTHHADAIMETLSELHQLFAAVETLCDASDLRDGPLENHLRLVQEQAAALGVQSLVLVGVCERIAADPASVSEPLTVPLDPSSVAGRN